MFRSYSSAKKNWEKLDYSCQSFDQITFHPEVEPIFAHPDPLFVWGWILKFPQICSNRKSFYNGFPSRAVSGKILKSGSEKAHSMWQIFFRIFAQYVCFQQCTLECRENILSWVCLSAGGSGKMEASPWMQNKPYSQKRKEIFNMFCTLLVKKSKVYIWEISVFGRKLCRKSF